MYPPLTGAAGLIGKSGRNTRMFAMRTQKQTNPDTTTHFSCVMTAASRKFELLSQTDFLCD
jgi:hypothetical protein